MGFFRSVQRLLRGELEFVDLALMKENLEAILIEEHQHDVLVEKTSRSFAILGGQAIQGQDYAKAITLFTQAINLTPEIGSNYFQRSLALSAQGEIQQAEGDYQTAVRLDPTFMELDFPRMSQLMLLKRIVHDLPDQPNEEAN
jgi:tetratricopeptide (TPR) repeat protein